MMFRNIQSSEVENATVLSSFQEPSGISGGCVVRSALIQEGVTVNRGSNVHKSVLMEHSHVDNNGQVGEFDGVLFDYIIEQNGHSSARFRFRFRFRL